MKLVRSRSVWGYAFYDFSNSAYILIVHSFLFPLVFQHSMSTDSDKGDFLWGLALASSVFLALLVGPILGHRADISNRKSILKWTIGIAALGLLALSFPFLHQYASWLFAIFVLINASFVVSQVVYDSFLPIISDRDHTSSVSGMSWGFGYVGGVICLVILQLAGATQIESASLGLGITASFYIVFSAVSLRLLPTSVGLAPLMSFKRALQEARIGRLLTPLLAIWLINEAIDVFIFFGPLFAKSTFDLTVRTVGVFLLVIQLVAFPATWFFGWLGRRIGLIKAITITIVIWGFVSFGVSTSNTTSQLLLSAILGALVIGSTQALLRAYYANLLEGSHVGLSFGFYSIAARSSAIIGPLSYGLISFATGDQRIAMVTTIIPFFIGIGLLLWDFRERRRNTAP